MYRGRRGLKYIVPANATQVEILLKKKDVYKTTQFAYKCNYNNRVSYIIIIYIYYSNEM